HDLRDHTPTAAELPPGPLGRLRKAGRIPPAVARIGETTRGVSGRKTRRRDELDLLAPLTHAVLDVARQSLGAHIPLRRRNLRTPDGTGKRIRESDLRGLLTRGGGRDDVDPRRSLQPLPLDLGADLVDDTARLPRLTRVDHEHDLLGTGTGVEHETGELIGGQHRRPVPGMPP